MADDTEFDGHQKFDHSDHPTDRPHPNDLGSPGVGKGDNAGQHVSRGGVRQEEPLTTPDSRGSVPA